MARDEEIARTHRAAERRADNHGEFADASDYAPPETPAASKAEALSRMSVPALRRRFLEITGEQHAIKAELDSRSKHK